MTKCTMVASGEVNEECLIYFFFCSMLLKLQVKTYLVTQLEDEFKFCDSKHGSRHRFH